jgi:hypothetical protein
MKMFYEDPTIEVMLFDVADVITSSSGYSSDQESYLPGIDTGKIEK